MSYLTTRNRIVHLKPSSYESTVYLKSVVDDIIRGPVKDISRIKRIYISAENVQRYYFEKTERAKILGYKI